MQMRIVLSLSALLVSCICIFMGEASPQLSSEPISTVQSLTELIKKEVVGDDKMKEEFKKDKKIFEEYRESNAKSHKKLSSHIDFDILGTTSMPQKWRAKFWSVGGEKKILLELLQSLIEEIVYPRAKDFLDKNKLRYTKTIFDEKRKVADVYYKVDFKKESGGIEKIDLMFRLHKKGGTWSLFDVRLEGELWTDMFKNQFNHIITTKSYAALIDKMRDKLKRVQAGEAY